MGFGRCGRTCHAPSAGCAPVRNCGKHSRIGLAPSTGGRQKGRVETRHKGSLLPACPGLRAAQRPGRLDLAPQLTWLGTVQVKPRSLMPSMVFWKSPKPGLPRSGSSQNGWKKNEAKPSRTTFTYSALVTMSSHV